MALAMALAAVVVAMAVVAMEVGVVVTEVAMADAETSALMDTLRLICCGQEERENSKLVQQRQAQPTNKGSLRQLTDNYLDMQAGAGRQAGRQAG